MVMVMELDMVIAGVMKIITDVMKKVRITIMKIRKMLQSLWIQIMRIKPSLVINDTKFQYVDATFIFNDEREMNYEGSEEIV